MQGRLLFASTDGGRARAATGMLEPLFDVRLLEPRMNEAAVHALARRAGIAVEWSDYAEQAAVAYRPSLRRILAALGLPCDTPDELAHSQRALLADTPAAADHRDGR